MNKHVKVQADRYRNPGRFYEKQKSLINKSNPSVLAKNLPSAYAALILKNKFPSAKKILCIGCRNDIEILSFQKMGFHASGIDVNQSEFKCIEQVDAHVLHEHYSEDSFDLVYASHSLEHMHDVNSVLKGIKKISRFGAWLTLPYDNRPSKLHPSILQIMKDKNFNPMQDNDASKMKDFLALEKYQVVHFQSGTPFNKKELCIAFSFIHEICPDHSTKIPEGIDA